MNYREHPVPNLLQRHIRCVWQLRDNAPSTGAQTVYPDGHCELIVHRGQPMQAFHPQHGWQQQAISLFAGQHRSPIRLSATGPVDCIGVRLQPAASDVIAGARLAELRDQIIDLAELDAAFASALIKACSDTADTTDASAALWELLSACLLKHPIDSRIEAAIQQLQINQGRNRVEPLAGAAAMSLRAFQMRFLEKVGLSAKEFARVQRLQATLQQLDSGVGSLSQLAADHGFADQAHATRELQHFTGQTPARLRDALRHQRDSDHTIKLAAAFIRGNASTATAAMRPTRTTSESC